MIFKARDHSITTELTWMNMVVSAAALLLACAAFAAYQLVTSRASIVRLLSIQAQIIGSNSVSALLFNDPHSAESTLAAFKAASNVVAAEIYTPDGQPFAGYWRGQRSQTIVLPKLPGGRMEAYWFKNKEVVVVRRINFQGKPAETVLIESDLQAINSRLKQYAVVVFAVLVACLAAVFLISPVIRKSIAEPILRLTETAKAVSRDKNYSLRTGPTNRRDELGVLAESFDEMLVQIQQRDADLQKARDDLELRVEERTAQLKAANKELEAFSYSVSHDLRAPLRQINAFSKILADQYERQLDAPAHHYLKLICDGARSMGQLVDDLLSMGRIGRQEAVRKATDLNLLVQGVVQELQPEFEGRHVDLQIGLLPTLECDPGLMKLVFVNLLSNAIKYTGRRERALIEIGQTNLDGNSVSFVRDNGAGFDPQYSHKLFGVFQRLHRAEDFEGNGIGLATVQRIIEKHGGRVWADGEVDNGATFSFTLAAAGHGAENMKYPTPAEVSHELQRS